ncbi:MAG TPA: class I SAM-dependent methyltransferase [Thermoanaerobaculia bacterium]
MTITVHNRAMSNAVLPQYALGASDAEHQRLINLASHEQDRVVDACRRAGVREGATAIDFGCGPLGALSALASVVGPRGTVIGIDASDAAIAKARALLSAFPNVRFVQADVNEVVHEEKADLAYCRLMLLHQADPARALRRMSDVLRPGGVVIAHEPCDTLMRAPASEPDVPAMTRVWELVIGAARARGANTDFGRRGKSYLEDAGFVVESHRAYAVHYPSEIGYDIPRVALSSLRPTLAQHGLASDDEIARLDRELEAAKQRDDVQWVSSPWMFEWIARKR